MSTVSGFPTDDATLHMLIGACKVNPDTGQTHLMDFLDMGSREKSRRLESDDGIPVYFVEYEEGSKPWSEHSAIIALAEEVLRLRHGD